MEVSRSPQWEGVLVAGGRSIEVAAGWRSPDRGRMEVSRSPQNGGLQVAAEWRSPGRSRIEVSRSRLNGDLQVAIILQVILGRRLL